MKNTSTISTNYLNLFKERTAERHMQRATHGKSDRGASPCKERPRNCRNNIFADAPYFFEEKGVFCRTFFAEIREKPVFSRKSRGFRGKKRCFGDFREKKASQPRKKRSEERPGELRRASTMQRATAERPTQRVTFFERITSSGK